MDKLYASLFAEFLKIRTSKILWPTISALCLAPVFGALFVIVLRNPSLAAGNEALTAKAALSGFTADWPSFFNLIAQAIGVGGVIVFGFVASWLFGREYSDHTIKDLFTLPISRTTLVIAKYIACIFWCFAITVAVTVVGIVIGFLLNLEKWESADFVTSIYRIGITAALATLLCPPVSFIASVGKGYLAPLGFVIFTVVIAQILGALGYGAYVPWAVPALFSGLGAQSVQPPGFVSYAILIITNIIGAAATVWWWNNADQMQ